MEIHGLGPVYGPRSIQGPQRSEAVKPQAPVEHLQGGDRIDISPEAELISRIHDMPDVRADRVAQIKAEIASGLYESDGKLDVAVGRLLDEIA